MKLFAAAIVSLTRNPPIQAECVQFLIKAEDLEQAQSEADQAAKDTWPNRRFQKAFVKELEFRITEEIPNLFQRPKTDYSH